VFRTPPQDLFEKIEYIVFKIALLILFVAGLLRLILGELAWLAKKRRKRPD
jgi:hypothetical protein